MEPRTRWRLHCSYNLEETSIASTHSYSVRKFKEKNQFITYLKQM